MAQESDKDSFASYLKHKCILKDGTWDIKGKISKGLITETHKEKPIPPDINNWYLIDHFFCEWIEMNCSEQIFVWDTNDEDLFLGINSDTQLTLLLHEVVEVLWNGDPEKHCFEAGCLDCFEELQEGWEKETGRDKEDNEPDNSKEVLGKFWDGDGIYFGTFFGIIVIIYVLRYIFGG